MKTKLINTGTYLFLISDSVIEINDWVLLDWGGGDYRWGKCIGTEDGFIHIYNQFGTNESKCDKERYPDSYWGKILAYYALKGSKELDLPLLPPFDSIDTEKLAQDEWNNLTVDMSLSANSEVLWKGGFQHGYIAAQPKQFSLEDMNRAIAFGFGICRKEDRAPFDLEIIKFIQSLSTQQLPTGFVPEIQVTAYDSQGKEIDFAIEKDDYTVQSLKIVDNIIQGTYKY